MDGFTGFKTATAEELPDAVPVMDPFHVVRLAAQALDECRRRVQQAIHGHRGRKGDPLYAARRTLHTGADLLTDKQKDRLTTLFAVDEHVEVEATWGIYQQDDRRLPRTRPQAGKTLMQQLIAVAQQRRPDRVDGDPHARRTLKQRAADVLAYFDRPGTSNGPTEAINGRLEHLRGSALGFRNLTNYIARCLLETGGFRPRLHRDWMSRRSGAIGFSRTGRAPPLDDGTQILSCRHKWTPLRRPSSPHSRCPSEQGHPSLKCTSPREIHATSPVESVATEARNAQAAA
jgi:hypothetical protein